MGLERPFDDIGEADIREIVASEESERRTLDYKRDRIGKTEGARKECLADVSSFANSAGGHLLLGVREEGGVAKEIVGLGQIDPDAEIARLENICREGLDPRIPNLQIKFVPVEGNRAVILIRIPKSWVRPHMVKFQTHNKFYARNSNGKYLLDVSEIRSLFLLSETARQRIERFRTDRLAQILSGQSAVPLAVGSPKIVLHVIPASFADPSIEFDVQQFSQLGLCPFWGSVTQCRYNFDGYLTYDAPPPDCLSYAQLFRSGGIETVACLGQAVQQVGRGREIPYRDLEYRLCTAVCSYVELLENLRVDPPIFFMLSMLSVKGYRMGAGSVLFGGPAQIDRDNLIVPEVVMESYEHRYEKVVRRLVDPVWNACGHTGSPNYDESADKFSWRS